LLQPVLFSLISIYVPDDPHTTGLMFPPQLQPSNQTHTPQKRFLNCATGPWAYSETIPDPHQSLAPAAKLARSHDRSFQNSGCLGNSKMRYWSLQLVVILDAPVVASLAFWNKDESLTFFCPLSKPLTLSWQCLGMAVPS
jgi:hypothetical protein